MSCDRTFQQQAGKKKNGGQWFQLRGSEQAYLWTGASSKRCNLNANGVISSFLKLISRQGAESG